MAKARTSANPVQTAPVAVAEPAPVAASAAEPEKVYFNRDINMAIMQGRLASAPELRFTPSGNKVCNFRLASSADYMSDGRIVKKTNFIRVACWNNVAESVMEFKKIGDEVTVEGAIATSESTTIEGKRQFFVEINARQVHFGRNGSRHGQPESQVSAEPQPEEEIPF